MDNKETWLIVGGGFVVLIVLYLLFKSSPPTSYVSSNPGWQPGTLGYSAQGVPGGPSSLGTYPGASYNIVGPSIQMAPNSATYNLASPTLAAVSPAVLSPIPSDLPVPLPASPGSDCGGCNCSCDSGNGPGFSSSYGALVNSVLNNNPNWIQTMVNNAVSSGAFNSLGSGVGIETTVS